MLTVRQRGSKEAKERAMDMKERMTVRHKYKLLAEGDLYKDKLRVKVSELATEIIKRERVTWWDK